MRKNGYILVDLLGREIEAGHEVFNFRGERCIVVDGTPPTNAASTGRVLVSVGDGSTDGEYYPSVFDLKWELIRTEHRKKIARLTYLQTVWTEYPHVSADVVYFMQGAGIPVETALKYCEAWSTSRPDLDECTAALASQTKPS